MKKGLVAAVLLLSVFFAGVLPAAAEIPVEYFTAEVTLLGMEEGRYGSWLLYVGLPDGETTVPTDVSFQFADGQNNPVSPDEFFAANEGKQIVIDFMEMVPGDYLVTSCRAGN